MTMTEKLKPGPETDARVATEVMGREAKVQGEPPCCSVPAQSKGFPGEWIYFCPSTDIAAAWEVLEKFVDVQVMQHSEDKPEDRWSCCVSIGIDGKVFPAYASTAPMAICEAALAAKERSDATD